MPEQKAPDGMMQASAPLWPPAGWEALARALWFEHLQRKRHPDEAMARWAQEAGVFAGMRRESCVALLLVDGEDPVTMLHTLGSWHLQTWPDAPWILVGDAESCRIPRVAAGLPPPMAVTPQPSAALLEQLGVDWIVNAAAGDLLHPSLAGAIALADREGKQAVAWDWIEHFQRRAAMRPLRRHRAPFRDTVAELEHDRRRRAYALHASHWDCRRSGWENRMRLSIAASLIGEHFEPLASYPDPPASDPVDVADALDIARVHWNAPFVEGQEGLQPDLPGIAISVVVMYRDRVELTLRALASVFRQVCTGSLELVLVDNASSAQTGVEIERFLHGAAGTVQVRMLSDPEPFNHSRQANLAAANATGEVLIFLNNDAELVDDDALETLARWAALPGVATAGPSLLDTAGKRAGGGMRARRLPGAEFNSPVEEFSAEDGLLNSETLGNSFACAAVAARTYAGLGGLDAVRFPAGYNDVDFCLRAAEAGLRHVTLGRIRATHAAGSTRGRQDEIAQKLLLRRQHPWTTVHACRQYQEEVLEMPEVALPQLYAAKAPERSP